jgi:ribosome-associated translation inhibitor RaiA/cold shock CspA family protein
METPLEIAFHDVEPSSEIESEIREHVARLERRFERLTGCRVSVELQHRQHRTGNLYEVHVELRVPGGELAVTREPHRADKKYARPDLHQALRDAFRAAERRLVAHKRKLNREVKPHPEAFVGQVVELHPEADHGFILTHEGTQLYFHRNSLLQGEFDRLQQGDKVRFIQTDGDTGPTAGKVWAPVGEPA